MDANYIPLGVKGEERLQSISWGPKVIGQTPEERKAIAREIRLAQRKDKKRIKSEAKQQRKLNDLLHRKLNRNTEKYSKNKDRNKQRAIDLERQRIRADAVKQAEHLAAIHDPSGKMFNVGEIIILPGGIVKSKEGMRKAAEAKEQKDREEGERNAIEKRCKDAEMAAKLEAEEAQRAVDHGLPAPTHFPAKEALKSMQRPKKISKKQLHRQEQLKPQPIPPKPVIPEGISLPEGEEDLLALWDITDEQILKRLADRKREKAKSRKQLIKIQQENKKLNKALKVRKREADNAGVIFDKEKARREILAAVTKPTDLTTKSDSSSGSDSDSESEDENVKVAKGKKLKAAPAPKLNLELIEKAAEIERARKEKKQAAKTKRRQERKQKAAEEAARLEAEKLAQTNVVEDDQTVKEAKASRREKNAAKRAEKLAKTANGESSSKKRKRTEIEEVISQDDPKKEKSHKKKKSKSETETVQDTRPVKKVKKVKESSDERLDKALAEQEAKMAAEAEKNDDGPAHGAEQWNPDALTGDAARRNKFLRLLGAGKGSSKGVEKDKKDKDNGVNIKKIQEELERQFEAGVKMKHDGGSKKRGLGA
ncbi:small acidic protein family-domain-containing protein [Cadophora sp. MPI-SDFR-AT-0126]|nr:small acidic protein family-domain-containing protein [Leotiomycetes sp. MPI-SDFR-AT-0126]